MTKSEFIEFIKNTDEEEIYNKLLQGQEVYYFKNIHCEYLLFYDEFKRFLSKKLGVHFNNIAIIGSAKTEFSLSPLKDFKVFNPDTSDLDIIIVSDEHFHKFWNTYGEISKNYHIDNYKGLTSNIFRKFISMKDNDRNYNNPTLIEWQKKINNFKTELQVIYKIFTPINYRIYSNWEAVQAYHIKGIIDLKSKL